MKTQIISALREYLFGGFHSTYLRLCELYLHSCISVVIRPSNNVKSCIFFSLLNVTTKRKQVICNHKIARLLIK